MLEQKCWKCGETICKDDLQGQSRRYCAKCYDQYTEEYKPIVAQYSILKNRVMFERAMRMMEKAGADMTRFRKYAIAVMNHSRDNPEQYLSAYEMIAATVLLEAGYDVRMNFKVLGYRVDILIPELHIALEIDGERHKYKKAEDGKRDVEIRGHLGKLWEVIRIPTKYIDEHPDRIPEAIKSLYDQKKEIREKNNGFLPETYSKREKMYYSENTLIHERKSYVI